jgi:tetratricopeptide (TPR) repeat protein
VDWDPKDEEKNSRSVARAYQALAVVSLSRTKFADAMEQYRKAEEIIARLAAADPNDLIKQGNLLRIERELGSIFIDRLGDTVGGQRYLRKALEISRTCKAKQPDDGNKGELANSLGKLAGSEMVLGHLEKARELYREEIAVRESFSQDKANDWEARRELAGLYAALATLTVKMRDLAEAHKLYDRCSSIREQIAAEVRDLWPAQNDLAVSYNNQGSMRFPLGDNPKAAREFHRKALDVFKKRAVLEPADFENKRSLGLTQYYEATCALHSGDKDGAAAGYRQCLNIFKALDIDPTAKPHKADLMLALARCGDHAGAATIAEELVKVPPKDEAIYVQAACGFALACGAARPAGTGNVDLVQHYVKRALECLRSAKDRGWVDVQGLETDTDLEPIRKDPAFQALLGELRQRGGKRP